VYKERNPQPIGDRGSLKWIQSLVGNPRLLSDAVRAAARLDADWRVEWVSPLEEDDWAEYRDAGFLLRVGLAEFVADLRDFWPKGGPQWDGLGRSSDNGVVLLEAKAHLSELSSSCGAGGDSLAKIDAALESTKAAFGVAAVHDWLNGFYQYANRLAHLRFLRDRGVPTLMAFLYFCGDSERGGPSSAEAWKEELLKVYAHLGISGSKPPEGVVNVFVPVGVLEGLPS
jgi:hypothetical protein